MPRAPLTPRHAALVLLSSAAGLTLSAALALAGLAPPGADLAPALLFGTLGHLVARRGCA